MAFVGEAQPAVRWLPVEGGMSAMRWVCRSAWLLGVATLVVAVVGLALMVWDWSTPVPGGSFGVRGFSGVWAVGFGGVGALLTRRRSGHPVGWIFAAAGMLAAVDFASFEYALAGVVGHRDLPAGEYAGWLQLWIWVPFVALITACLPLLFPDGRLPGPRWRPAVWAAAGCGVIAATGLAITPGVVVNLRALRNPFGVHPAAVTDTVIAVGLAGLLGCVVLAVWSLLVRARRGTSVERQQIKWLACAGCLVAATLVPSTILSLSTGTAARIAEVALMVAIVTVPVAVAVAVLRYRLYDIDRVTRWSDSALRAPACLPAAASIQVSTRQATVAIWPMRGSPSLHRPDRPSPLPGGWPPARG